MSSLDAALWRIRRFLSRRPFASEHHCEGEIVLAKATSIQLKNFIFSILSLSQGNQKKVAATIYPVQEILSACYPRVQTASSFLPITLLLQVEASGGESAAASVRT